MFHNYDELEYISYCEECSTVASTVHDKCSLYFGMHNRLITNQSKTTDRLIDCT